MALPSEITRAMVQCLATCFFHKYKMEVFLLEVGVPSTTIERHRGPIKAVWSASILAELGQSNSGYEVQRRVLTALCDLKNAPDDNAKVDRTAAVAALQYLKTLAMRYRESLACASFDTSDNVLDSLLNTARQKFLDPDVHDRREALEKLWDAWERLKTLESSDKQASVRALLDKVSNEPAFRKVLETEARALTEIGNSFMIRHSEIGKVPIQDDEHVDYLFHRMFVLIRLILRQTGRGV